ncbi:MAG TPA: hypothetical protein VHU80_00100 [Polyangiaceae bacterium]|nr:hypothetical protein [Polyangiaceae bacterium]
MQSNICAKRSTKCRRLSGCVGLTCSLALLQSSPDAFAEGNGPAAPERPSATPVPAPSETVTRARTELGEYAEQARRERVVANITTVTAGAALVPTGIVLSLRPSPLAKTLGIGMAVGGSIPLLFVFATVLPSRMERLRDEFDERRTSGVPERELLKSIDEKWADAARSAHNRRVVVGIVDLTLGAAATGAGLFFLLSDRVGGMNRDDQYTLGWSLAGSGVPVAVFGVRSLVQRSLEEASWAAHRAAHGLGATTARAQSMPRLGVAPLPGGAAAAMSFVF